MGQVLHLAVWNDNSLAQHIQELKIFLVKNDTDVMLSLNLMSLIKIL